MSFRLNPFKVARAVGIVAIIIYGVVLITGYKKSRVTTTESVTKDMKIRKKDFYNSEEYKNNLTLPTQVIENNNETVAKEMEQAKATQTVNLKNNNKANSSEQKLNTNNETKKREEQVKLEAQKKLEEQKRQEAAKQEEKQAEIKKAQQEKVRKQAEEREKSQASKGPKKYIQVASVSSEASAKAMAKKLGGSFYYKKTKVNGRTAYVIMSNMTDNPDTLKSMENQAKSKSGGRYMIRSVGK